MNIVNHFFGMLLLNIGVFIPIAAYAQINTYQFEQLDSLQKIKKNVVIFIHTDWCKYCQAMKQTTFKTDNVISKLNTDFYFIELNGEEKRNIYFKEHAFKYVPTGKNTGSHELAEQLGTVDGKISYPTICVLNPNNEIIYQHSQFIRSQDLLEILRRLK
jgi:thioredoxin-related protein